MSNILSEVHPELVAEWSDKNLPLTPDRITYGSNKVVWWKGACGHEWQTSVKARSNGENCPICSGARVIEGINDLATLKPELADEWSSKNDPLKPTMVTTGSHKKVIWQDKLSAMFGRMSKEMAQDTKKLSAMQTELQGAKGHLKNMGLLFMGKAAKEAEHSKTDKGVLSRLSRLFEKAQKGFASLEQKAMDTADKLRVSRVKSSVKENLSRYRAAAKAEKGTERSEPAASKEENRTVQALGQISAPHQQKSNLSKER